MLARRFVSRVVTSVFVVAIAACGTSSGAGKGGSGGGPLAVDDADQPPPHVFTPRAHPPRQHPLPPEPDIGSLPRLVDRTRQCLGGGRVATTPSPGPVQKKKRRRSRKGGSKSSSRSGGHVPYRPAAPRSQPAPKPADAAGAAPPPSSAPEPEPSVASNVDKKSSGRRKREPKKDAAPSAPAAEPAAEAEMADADMEAGAPLQIAESDPDDAYHDWGASIYLSNDDTMSLSSAQRVIYAIDRFLPLPAEHIRPHELLNYFSFETTEVAPTDDFSVRAGIEPDPDQPGIYNLALAVRGRPVGIDERRNVSLTLVIDRSGSMNSEGRMEYLQRGLQQMLGQLKRGDMIHMVAFDHQVCTPIENFVVGRDQPRVLESAISALRPRGSTDLHSGLRTGYEIADRAYQPTYSNRVVMITDAQANTGVTDAEMISMISKFYDTRRIRLSGVGVGTDFNDGLLDRLTERGRGAYVFLGSPAEVDAVFGARFASLVETTANDVHFQLHLPPSLRMNVFYGEESSTVKEDVQAIHYFANTSQLFLSDLMARGGQMRPQDSVMLTIEYDDPETGDEMIEEYAFNLGEISEETANVAKGRFLMRFIDGLAWMASRPLPGAWSSRAGAWNDGAAWEECEQGRADLQRLGQDVSDDPEIRRVMGLWEKYCSRYERPRNPVKRPVPSDTWPSAAGE